ncbi:MAG: class A beta-lactamase-related serine hydrolase [Pelatocladus maniniholoensis HA4357-MV3]|uniref:Class A beta-lactamase-related serine hydrolase n=1 Tax=Pelatocladus maniniholoensis HA4357-MV3 TaxID=1117104 RepID=A0A9E3HBB6_9NOST|nr:class A beta-lactamase-related serine hydrolase [Pelatocladus maniniholoensis HA4357-MV3]
MDQQSKRQSNGRDRKIAELEAKLERAYLIIENLQQQNIQLKRQIEGLNHKEEQTSTFLQNPTSVSYPQKLHVHKKPNVAKQQPKIPQITEAIKMSKSRITKLSHLQFYGLIALVVIAIVGLFGVSSLLAQRAKNQKIETINNSSAQPPTVISQESKLPTQPTNINTQKPFINQPDLSTQPVNLPVESSSQLAKVDSALTYNVKVPPKFKKSEKLDKHVNIILDYIKEKNLPTQGLSITLIDLNKNTISGYQQDSPRYPASVVKLFWMTILEAKIKQGFLPLSYTINSDLNAMMLKSDNDAASRIVDLVSGTYSYEKKLSEEQFQTWKQQRQSLNFFFQKAGYKDINVSQKTYPISYLKVTEPKGADLQLRGDHPNNPRRNKITTYQTARLMYEIFTSQAVGPEYSEQMIGLLTRDLHPEAWKLQPPNPDEFNPVENFLGESLAPDADQLVFASKAGWTTASRQEVAYVATKDGKSRYIIAIFGEDPAYAASKNVFPDISRLVFESMRNGK